MQYGKIKSVKNPNFFFVVPDEPLENGKDVFVHISAAQASGIDVSDIYSGRRVGFVAAPDDRHPGHYKAVSLELV